MKYMNFNFSAKNLFLTLFAVAVLATGFWLAEVPKAEADCTSDSTCDELFCYKNGTTPNCGSYADDAQTTPSGYVRTCTIGGALNINQWVSGNALPSCSDGAAKCGALKADGITGNACYSGSDGASCVVRSLNNGNVNTSSNAKWSEEDLDLSGSDDYFACIQCGSSNNKYGVPMSKTVQAVCGSSGFISAVGSDGWCTTSPSASGLRFLTICGADTACNDHEIGCVGTAGFCNSNGSYTACVSPQTCTNGACGSSTICTRNNPTVTITDPTSKSQTKAKRVLATYTVGVTNNDTSACVSASFTLSLSGCPSGWTCSLGSTSLSMNSGNSSSTSLSITSSSSASPGSSSIIVTATGNSKTGSDTAIYVVSDLTVADCTDCSTLGSTGTCRKNADDSTPVSGCSDAQIYNICAVEKGLGNNICQVLLSDKNLCQCSTICLSSETGKCSDGIDNDCDKATDSADSDCPSTSPLCTAGTCKPGDSSVYCYNSAWKNCNPGRTCQIASGLCGVAGAVIIDTCTNCNPSTSASGCADRKAIGSIWSSGLQTDCATDLDITTICNHEKPTYSGCQIGLSNGLNCSCSSAITPVNHCLNSKKDEDETGIDCGGADCQPCCGVNGKETSLGEVCDPSETISSCASPKICSSDCKACNDPPCSGANMFVSPLAFGYCTIGEILTKATNWILSLVSGIIILIIIIGGIMYISSSGDEERLRTSKNIIFYAIVGLALILVSAALINEVKNALK